MIEISMTPPGPMATGSLGKFVAWISHAWEERQTRASFAGMSEREFQDIGWGQADRWAKQISDVEPPEDRRARMIALRAWHVQKAA